MSALWKAAVRRTIDHMPGAGWIRARSDARQLRDWEARCHERPTPHAYKRWLIIETARRYQCKVLVETGTCIGEMIQGVLPHFEEIHSIELSPALAAQCRLRFAGYTHVHLHEGDSGQLLKHVLRSVRQRAVLWLDAHYSGGPTARGVEDSPIARELEVIAHGDHCVLVDDAHMFDGRGGYPTIAALESLCARLLPSHSFAVSNNIVEVLPHPEVP